MENIAAKNQIFKTIFRGAGAYQAFYSGNSKKRFKKKIC